MPTPGAEQRVRSGQKRKHGQFQAELENVEDTERSSLRPVHGTGRISARVALQAPSSANSGSQPLYLVSSNDRGRRHPSRGRPAQLFLPSFSSTQVRSSKELSAGLSPSKPALNHGFLSTTVPSTVSYPSLYPLPFDDTRILPYGAFEHNPPISAETADPESMAGQPDSSLVNFETEEQHMAQPKIKRGKRKLDISNMSADMQSHCIDVYWDELAKRGPPRPSNEWILFRSAYVKKRRSMGKEQKKLSKTAAEEWESMSVEAKQPFISEARRLKENFKRAHPEYKYRPIQGERKAQYDAGKDLQAKLDRKSQATGIKKETEQTTIHKRANRKAKKSQPVEGHLAPSEVNSRHGDIALPTLPNLGTTPCGPIAPFTVDNAQPTPPIQSCQSFLPRRGDAPAQRERPHARHERLERPEASNALLGNINHAARHTPRPTLPQTAIAAQPSPMPVFETAPAPFDFHGMPAQVVYSGPAPVHLAPQLYEGGPPYPYPHSPSHMHYDVPSGNMPDGNQIWPSPSFQQVQQQNDPVRYVQSSNPSNSMYRPVSSTYEPLTTIRHASHQLTGVRIPVMSAVPSRLQPRRPTVVPSFARSTTPTPLGRVGNKTEDTLHLLNQSGRYVRGRNEASPAPKRQRLMNTAAATEVPVYGSSWLSIPKTTRGTDPTDNTAFHAVRTGEAKPMSPAGYPLQPNLTSDLQVPIPARPLNPNHGDVPIITLRRASSPHLQTGITALMQDPFADFPSGSSSFATPPSTSTVMSPSLFIPSPITPQLTPDGGAMPDTAESDSEFVRIGTEREASAEVLDPSLQLIESSTTLDMGPDSFFFELFPPHQYGSEQTGALEEYDGDLDFDQTWEQFMEVDASDIGPNKGRKLA